MNNYYRNIPHQWFITQLLNNTNTQSHSLASYYQDPSSVLGSSALLPLPIELMQKNMWNSRMSPILGNTSFRERQHTHPPPRPSSRESLTDSKTPSNSDNGLIPTPKSLLLDNRPATLETTITNKGVKRQLDLTSSPKQGDTSKRRHQVGKQPSPTNLNDNEELGKGRCSPHITSGNRPLLLTPPPTPRNSSESSKGNKMDELSESIWQHHLTHKQTEELLERKMRLKEAVFGILQSVLPFCKLYVVGSSLNGFGSKTSDMDMCLMLTESEIDQGREATEILQYILKAVKRKNFICRADLIRAKVPIIKFEDRISGVEVDLNINNVVGIRNTHLLKCYGRMDWRVRPLVMMIKRWARDHDINDASRQTLSSYSLVMMVIHFLQCGCSPPVIPCLQKMYPMKFRADLNISLLPQNEELSPYQSENKQHLGELLLSFLDYFTNKFNFSKEAMSVRLGTKLPKIVVQHQRSYKNNPGQWKFICIEEPFDLTNTARSVYSEPEFQRIKLVFRNTYMKLSQTKTLCSILKKE